MNFEAFDFKLLGTTICPICDRGYLAMSATNRSICIECDNQSCKMTYFYRRVLYISNYLIGKDV